MQGYTTNVRGGRMGRGSSRSIFVGGIGEPSSSDVSPSRGGLGRGSGRGRGAFQGNSGQLPPFEPAPDFTQESARDSSSAPAQAQGPAPAPPQAPGPASASAQSHGSASAPAQASGPTSAPAQSTGPAPAQAPASAPAQAPGPAPAPAQAQAIQMKQAGVFYDPADLATLMQDFHAGGQHHPAVILPTTAFFRSTIPTPVSTVPIGALISTVSMVDGEAHRHSILQKFDPTTFVWIHRLVNGSEDPAFGGIETDNDSLVVHMLKPLVARSMADVAHATLPHPLPSMLPPQAPPVPQPTLSSQPTQHPVNLHPTNLAGIIVRQEPVVKDWEKSYLAILRSNCHWDRSYCNGVIVSASKFQENLLNTVRSKTPPDIEDVHYFKNTQLWRALMLMKFSTESALSDKPDSSASLQDFILGHEGNPVTLTAHFKEIGKFIDTTYKQVDLWIVFFEDLAMRVDKACACAKYPVVKAAVMLTHLNKLLATLSQQLYLETYYLADCATQDKFLLEFADKFVDAEAIKVDYTLEVNSYNARNIVKEQLATALALGKRTPPATGGGGGSGGGGSGGGGNNKKSKTGNANSNSPPNVNTNPGKPVCIFLALHAAGDTKTKATCSRPTCRFDHGDRSLHSKTETMKAFATYMKSPFWKRKSETGAVMGKLKQWVDGPSGCGLP